MTAYERYRKKTLVRLNLALNRNTDSDILSWLDRQPNKAAAVKNAIREEIDELITFRLTSEQEIALYNYLLLTTEEGYNVNYMTPESYERIKSICALLKSRSGTRTKPLKHDPLGVTAVKADAERPNE